MELCIWPSKLKGSVTPPKSKSHLQRLLLASMLAGKNYLLNGQACEVSEKEKLFAHNDFGEQISKDVTATLHATQVFLNRGGVYDCKENATLLRLLMPIVSAVYGEGEFVCEAGLFARPMGAFFDELSRHGICVSKDCLDEHNEIDTTCNIQESVKKAYAEVTSKKYLERVDKCGRYMLEGRLSAGEYILDGNISSQFISGLLFALPLCAGDSLIKVKKPVQSYPYIKMTMDVLSEFGIRVKSSDDIEHLTIRVKGGQKYILPKRFACADFNDLLEICETDWSAGAYWLCANLLGSDIEILGLSKNSVQGDSVAGELFEIFEKHLGNEIEIDACDIPDLVPVIAVAGAYVTGAGFSEKTLFEEVYNEKRDEKEQFSENTKSMSRLRTVRIKNCERLRYKESDRLEALCEEFGKLGIRIYTQKEYRTRESEASLGKLYEIEKNTYRNALGATGISNDEADKIENTAYEREYERESLIIEGTEKDLTRHVHSLKNLNETSYAFEQVSGISEVLADNQKSRTNDLREPMNESSGVGIRTSAHGDHRIAMALAIYALCCDLPIIIEGCEAVAKSYPAFFDDFKKLGGKIT